MPGSSPVSFCSVPGKPGGRRTLPIRSGDAWPRVRGCDRGHAFIGPEPATRRPAARATTNRTWIDSSGSSADAGDGPATGLTRWLGAVVEVVTLRFVSGSVLGRLDPFLDAPRPEPDGSDGHDHEGHEEDEVHHRVPMPSMATHEVVVQVREGARWRLERSRSGITTREGDGPHTCPAGSIPPGGRARSGTGAFDLGDGGLTIRHA